MPACRHLQRHRNMEVVAVDQSPEMVAALKQHLPDVTALQGSATDLPAEANSLDALFVAQVRIHGRCKLFAVARKFWNGATNAQGCHSVMSQKTARSYQ